MGERVEVGPAGRDARAAERGAGEPPGVPLDYARRGVEHWRQGPDAFAARLGGWRQLGFAAGLSFVLCGVGVALGPRTSAGFLMWLGGLLLGISVRVPRWSD